jgi:hypothetical protein
VGIARGNFFFVALWIFKSLVFYLMGDMNMKKVIIIILSAFTIFSATGCGSNVSKGLADSSSKTSTNDLSKKATDAQGGSVIKSNTAVHSNQVGSSSSSTGSTSLSSSNTSATSGTVATSSTQTEPEPAKQTQSTSTTISTAKTTPEPTTTPKLQTSSTTTSSTPAPAPQTRTPEPAYGTTSMTNMNGGMWDWNDLTISYKWLQVEGTDQGAWVRVCKYGMVSSGPVDKDGLIKYGCPLVPKPTTNGTTFGETTKPVTVWVYLNGGKN